MSRVWLQHRRTRTCKAAGAWVAHSHVGGPFADPRDAVFRSSKLPDIVGHRNLDSGKDNPYFLSDPEKALAMIVSKLTTKAQTTIPQPVRTALGVREGDELAYAIEDGRVILTKAQARTVRRNDPLEDPFATFWEWSSAEDAEDYADL